MQFGCSLVFSFGSIPGQSVSWFRTMTRIVLALLLFAGLLQGQFVNLVAPGDGADLYFSSERPLKGSDATPQGRIFRVGTEPVTLILERPTPIPPPYPPNTGE